MSLAENGGQGAPVPKQPDRSTSLDVGNVGPLSGGSSDVRPVSPHVDLGAVDRILGGQTTSTKSSTGTTPALEGAGTVSERPVRERVIRVSAGKQAPDNAMDIPQQEGGDLQQQKPILGIGATGTGSQTAGQSMTDEHKDIDQRPLPDDFVLKDGEYEHLDDWGPVSPPPSDTVNTFQDLASRLGDNPAKGAQEVRGEEQQDVIADEPRSKPLYRGTWIDGQLEAGDSIPVRISTGREMVLTRVEIDTEWMDEGTTGFTRERINEAYARNSGRYTRLIEAQNATIDPETLHLMTQVQRRTESLLQTNPDVNTMDQRAEFLSSRDTVKLSEMVGNAACVETAAVGKMLYNKVGVDATYMSGVVVDGKGPMATPADHAFVVLDDPQGPGSLVHDINRPYPGDVRYPRVLRTAQRLTHETFAGHVNKVVPATDIYTGQTLHFGVGNPGVVDPVNYADS